VFLLASAASQRTWIGFQILNTVALNPAVQFNLFYPACCRTPDKTLFVRRHMVFALDTDDGSLLAFSATAEATAHCKGIDVKEGFWLFFAEDGSPLEARFERQDQADSALSFGAYVLQRAMSGLWLQERFAQVTRVEGCGLSTIAELDETLKINRAERAARGR
jgi:hypothetical protein